MEKSSDNIKKYSTFSASEKYMVPATSVVTFVGKIDDRTAVIDLKESDKLFTLFPNPTKDILHISLSNNYSDSIIEISDISGKKVLTKTLDKLENNMSFNISNWNKGVYFISYLNSSKISTLKFIVN